MKKRSIIFILIVAVSMLCLMTACKEDSGMSIDERIEAFVSDLNDSNRNGIFKDHFHSDSTSYSNGTEATVNAVFPNVSNGYSYSTTGITGTGSSRTVAILGGKSDAVDGNYTFVMEEDGDDSWYILSINPGGLN